MNLLSILAHNSRKFCVRVVPTEDVHLMPETTDHIYKDKKVNDVRWPTKNVLPSKRDPWTKRRCVPCARPLY
jgi:hypothetical protein